VILRDGWGRVARFERKRHPHRPELPSYYCADLDLWLVERLDEAGGYTLYTKHNSWADGRNADGQLLLNLLNLLQSEVNGPYTEDSRRQSAAELLADLEAT
jgi:hypothetical protein